MTRVKRGNVSIKNRKKYLTLSKGFKGLNSRLSTFASEQIVQSLNSAYKGKKLKKRNFRRIYLIKFSKYLKTIKFKYSNILDYLKKNNIYFNSKILALLAKEQYILLTMILTNNDIIINFANIA